MCRLARALALDEEAAAAIRLLACADALFEELEINQSNAERWLIRMNEETRAMVAASIDEATKAAAAEEAGR